MGLMRDEDFNSWDGNSVCACVCVCVTPRIRGSALYPHRQSPLSQSSLTFDLLLLKGAQHNRAEEVQLGPGRYCEDVWMDWMDQWLLSVCC